MDVIFLAFANSRNTPLITLQEEDNTLYNLLSPRQLKQHFILGRDSYATIESVSQYISQSRDQLRLFLYSGHAGRDQLMLEGQSANAEGIAHLLGQCKGLRLVFLNGCSTVEQVKGLLDQGVPAVLATSAPIEDRKATEFSIRFFQALNDQSTVKEAFELAKGEIMMRYKDLKPEVHNILGEPGGSDAHGIQLPENIKDGDASLWGLYVREGSEDVLNWKLPFETTVAGTESFVPNELLIDTLIETLAPFREEVQKIVEEESLGATKSILDKREAILKAVPHPVSEQLRKLLVDEAASGGGGLTFFSKVGPDRLRQIVVIYNTLLELMGYTMLAQLWDVSDNEDVKIADELREELRGFFKTKVEGHSAQRFVSLIGVARRILEANNISCFINEISELSKLYADNTPLKEAIDYLEQVDQKITGKSADSGEISEMCILGEQKLAVMMKHLGFLANYTLASVKEIDVLNYRHFKAPKYLHHIVRLEQRFVGLAENQEIADKLLACNSVLFMRNDDTSQFLNLSPFIIDENAFDAKASIAKLYVFDQFQKSSGAYAFRFVYKPADTPLVIEQQKHFQILKAQFDAFAKALFNQPMDAL